MKSVMTHHYYIGTGPEADALIADLNQGLSARNEARHKLCAEYEAQGVVESRRSVDGLVFKAKQDIPHLKLTKNEGGYFWYAPRHNFKAGKVLADRLRDKTLTFDASDYIIGSLKLHRMVAGKCRESATGMALYHSVAGFCGDKIVVKIPGGAGGGDPMPAIPSWLREVKESEFLAAQGK